MDWQQPASTRNGTSGPPDWADLIFGAYQNPGEAMDALFAESGGTIGKPIEDTEAA